MREWQVGDPAGDGNDIGVPDLPYMGYLNDDDEYENENLEEFRFFFTQFHGGFEAGNYEMAFGFLWEASEIYEELSGFEKSHLSDNPFSHRYVVELCSTIYNRHDENQSKALEIIKRYRIPVISCDDCRNIYPNYYKYCISCGKSFEKSLEEEFESKLREVLIRIVYDKSAINTLVSRTRILMESNDCILAKIEEPDLMNVHFIFEKEHRYFKTIYRCLFSQEFHDLRIFEDFEITHDHTRLLEDESFKKLIKDTETKTGFRFKNSDGGYNAKLDDNRFDFVFTDHIYVFVRFDMGNGHMAVYDLNLDNMELSEDYSVY